MKRRYFLQRTASASLALVLPWEVAQTADMTDAALTFGMVTDAHQDIMHDGAQRLQAFVDATLRRRTDFNIQLGDFCFPIRENQPFLDIWNQYKGPKYHVLGNHDMDKSSKEETREFWEMEASYYSFDRGGYHFVVLDANFLREGERYVDYAHANFYIDNAYRTWISPEQIEWLAGDLRNTVLPTIIFSHQGLAHEHWGVKNRRDLQLLFEAINREAGFTKVIACFNGHNHVNDCRRINGIYYIEVNSLSYQWLGEKYPCYTRYPRETYDKKPILAHVAPYEDPLFAMVTLTPGSLRIEGVHSRWLGPSPTALGMPVGFYGIAYSPEISDRQLPVGP